MRGIHGFSMQRTVELEQISVAKWSPDAFRRFQCVWLRQKLNLSAKEIAEVLELSITTVHRIWAEFRRDGGNAIDGKANRGGRRNNYMTFEEEAAFLRAQSDVLGTGGEVDVHAIKTAFEKAIGLAVHKTTIYRLLERHGFGKGVDGRRGLSSRAKSGAASGRGFHVRKQRPAPNPRAR